MAVKFGVVQNKFTLCIAVCQVATDPLSAQVTHNCYPETALFEARLLFRSQFIEFDIPGQLLL